MVKQKSKNCLYCASEMDAKTTRARFCSDKCRVYWNRDNPKPIEAQNDQKKENTGKETQKRKFASQRAENKPESKIDPNAVSEMELQFQEILKNIKNGN